MIDTGADAGANGFIRGIELRRRRSRVPWIYSVYHARRRLSGPPRRLRNTLEWPKDGETADLELDRDLEP
jgi:hypothetical protein